MGWRNRSIVALCDITRSCLSGATCLFHTSSSCKAVEGGRSGAFSIAAAVYGGGGGGAVGVAAADPRPRSAGLLQLMLSVGQCLSRRRSHGPPLSAGGLIGVGGGNGPPAARTAPARTARPRASLFFFYGCCCCFLANSKCACVSISTSRTRVIALTKSVVVFEADSVCLRREEESEKIHQSPFHTHTHTHIGYALH